MKPSLILLFVTLNLSLVESSSQEWAPVGAKWHYTLPVTGHCVYVESVTDTIVNQRESKILEIRYCQEDMFISKEIIHQKGDSIYFLHDSTFVLLYNLSASISDTIEVYPNEFIPIDGFLHQGHPESIRSFGYKIIGYDSINISGDWRKMQRIENLYNTGWKISIGNYPYVVDGIGSMCYFFGRFAGMVPEELMGQLRCYSDDQVDWQNPDWAEDCDYLFTGIDDPSLSLKPLIYPNPFRDRIKIEMTNQGEYRASIYDQTGKLISTFSFNKSLSIGDNLVKGLYILKIESDNHQLKYKINKI